VDFKKTIFNRIQFHHGFLLLVIAVAILIVVPNLLKQGMFMDGQQYACVAKNLANHKGTFWKPFLSETWLIQGKNEFLEHPPLFYFIESFSFKVFGEFYLTEKLFSLFTFILHVLLIHLLYKEIANIDYKKYTWIGIFCWSIIPIVSWVFQNNMIEELLSIFTLLSALFSIKAIHSNKFEFVYIVLSGLFVVFATLTKGLPGFFPILIPFLSFFVLKKSTLQKTIFHSLFLVSIPVLIYACIFIFNQEAKESLMFYINNRLLHRISEQPSTDYRLFTLVGLLQELLPLFGLISIIIIINKFKKTNFVIDSENKNTIVFFTLIGISASFPLMLTMVQNKFYFFPALPYFAIALGLLINVYIKQFFINIHLQKNKFLFFFIGCIAMMFSITFSVKQINKFSRDEKIITDVNSIIKSVGHNKTIGVEKDVYYQWNFQFYLLRFGDISIAHAEKKYNYYISYKTTINEDTNYLKSKLYLNNYTLYSLKK
jgi:4-amino-4-deoxy-L-arabinose transferase-like glycosyltransferase